MTTPRYISISAIGNRVTAVTCRTIAGSAPAPQRPLSREHLLQATQRVANEHGVDRLQIKLSGQVHSHAALNHADDAQRAVKRALLIEPTATLSKWASHELAPYKKPQDLEHLRELLRRAGLPE